MRKVVKRVKIIVPAEGKREKSMERRKPRAPRIVPALARDSVERGRRRRSGRQRGGTDSSSQTVTPRVTTCNRWIDLLSVMSSMTIVRQARIRRGDFVYGQG